MSHILQLYKSKDSLHHAYYFVEHKLGEAIENLKEFLNKHLKFETQGNPDFWHKKFETFTVDDARILKEAESRKDLNNLKIFVIETDFITDEAQNSLLKVFEEPTRGTHFFIISKQDTLLPTLRSRMQVFTNNEDAENEKRNNFLNMSLKEKLDFVKEIVDGIKDEEMTKQNAISFLNNIEEELYEGGLEKNERKLKACENARLQLYDRGAPIKIILENLVLSI